MPTILRVAGYRFHFFSNERAEPPHVHVAQAERVAKFWLEPVSLAFNIGFRSGEINELHRTIEDNLQLLLDAWNDYFAQ